MDVEEVSKIIDKPKSSSYKLIRQLNSELEEKGYITLRGKISRKYFVERLYGFNESKGPLEVSHASIQR